MSKLHTTTTLYGISNCDTVRRARAWLVGHDVAYTFHDFKKNGVPQDHLNAWLNSAGWQTVLNRKGNTWRGLSDAEREAVADAASAQALMLRQPSVIKRPVVEWADGRITVGFDAAVWATLATAA